MSKKLETTFKVRAAIPAQVVELLRLTERAQEVGLELVEDATGNIEGAWKTSLLTLGEVIETLRKIGLQDFMIQRLVITTIISVPESKAARVMRAVKNNGAGQIWQSQDVFSRSVIIGCTLNCEDANKCINTLHKFGIRRIVAFQSYEIVTERTNA